MGVLVGGGRAYGLLDLLGGAFCSWCHLPWPPLLSCSYRRHHLFLKQGHKQGGGCRPAWFACRPLDSSAGGPLRRRAHPATNQRVCSAGGLFALCLLSQAWKPGGERVMSEPTRPPPRVPQELEHRPAHRHPSSVWALLSNSASPGPPEPNRGSAGPRVTSHLHGQGVGVSRRHEVHSGSKPNVPTPASCPHLPPVPTPASCTHTCLLSPHLPPAHTCLLCGLGGLSTAGRVDPGVERAAEHEDGPCF